MFTSEDVFAALFPNPSPQLRTVIAYFRGVMKQDAQACLSLVTDDHQYEWIARGFDSLGARVKTRAQTQEFMETLFGKWVKNYTVRGFFFHLYILLTRIIV